MGLLAKLKNSLSQNVARKDAADELAWHLEQRTQEYVEQGMAFEEARAAARRRLGNVTGLEEDTAESDLLVWLGSVKCDIALALRMLRRAPTVTAIAVLSLALGIGVDTEVFTLMKQVVLDCLPVPAPDQLVILHSSDPESGSTYRTGMKSSFSYPLYQDLNTAASNIFQGILALRPIEVSLTGQSETQTVHGDLVSGNFFQVLKVTPWRGRLLTPADDQNPGANAVAVLGYGVWRRNFGSDRGVVNGTILLNKRPYVVVGIGPPQFYGIDVSLRADLFVPMSMKQDMVPDQRLLTNRLDHWCSLIGRLKPGLSAQQASAALGAIYPRLRDQDLASMKSPPARSSEKTSRRRRSR